MRNGRALASIRRRSPYAGMLLLGLWAIECALTRGPLSPVAMTYAEESKGYEESRCRDTRVFTGQEYWFWEGDRGVVDIVDAGDTRTGRVGDHPTLPWRPQCFEVPLAEVNDPLARLIGYKKVVNQWIDMVFAANDKDPTRFDASERTELGRLKLKQLTGREFTSPNDAYSWWEENGDYVVWSGARNVLEVDDEAKRRNTPIAPLIPVEEFDGATYWYHSTIENLSDISETETEIVGKVSGHHGRGRFHIAKDHAADPQGKAEGMKRALDRYIECLDAQYRPYIRDLAVLRLQHLTGKSFAKPEEWKRWYEANASQLKWSEEAQRFVVEEKAK